MAILLQLIASGVAVGMIYAAIAFGYQLTFATSKTLNFGQGEALALGALFGLTLVPFVGYWLMIPLVLVFGFALGAVVERLAVRPAIKIKSEYGWIMATIAPGIIFRNLAENIWGRDDLKFPSPLPDAAVTLPGSHTATIAEDLRVEFETVAQAFAGVAICEAIRRAFGVEFVWVTRQGLEEGLALDLLAS